LSGTTSGQPLEQPLGALNRLRTNETQRVVSSDLYSVLSQTCNVSLGAQDILGEGDYRGIVIGVMHSGRPMDDPSTEQTGDANTAPPEEAKVENPGPMPYAYIVNIPELSYMLPAIPKVGDSTYGTILKIYRDNGFSFRVRPNQTAEPADIGDRVKVNYTNPTNLTGGYYVGNESLRGSHPGSPKKKVPGGGSGKKGEPLGKKRKKKAKGAERELQNAYLDKVDLAKEEISNYKCNMEANRYNHSSFAMYANNSYSQMEENKKVIKSVQFFNIPGAFGKSKNTEGSAFKLREDIHHTIHMVKHLIAQDPPSLRYIAETIKYWNYGKKNGSHNRRGNGGSFVVRCKQHRLDAKGKAHYESQGKKCTGSDGKGWKCSGIKASEAVYNGFCYHKSPSNHAHGLAFDINPHFNPMKSGIFTTDIPPTFVACFEACGWHWGGRYGSATGGTAADGMHFEYKGAREETQQGWNQCRQAIDSGMETDFYKKNWEDLGSTPDERAEKIIADPKYGTPGVAIYTNWYWHKAPDQVAKYEGGNPAHLNSAKPTTT
jgi:hypothetical protein